MKLLTAAKSRDNVALSSTSSRVRWVVNGLGRAIFGPIRIVKCSSSSRSSAVHLVQLLEFTVSERGEEGAWRIHRASALP